MYEIKLDGQWVDVPEWARWVAQDKNGLWFFYARKPKLGMRHFWFNLQNFTFALKSVQRKNWEEQIYRIVRK